MTNYRKNYLHLLIIIISIINIKSDCFEYSCEECTSSEYGDCIKCRESFSLVDGTCPCSDSDCALCSSGFPGLHLCYHCKNGYYNYNGDCDCIIDNCDKCNENFCDKCKTNYFYNSTSEKCEENDIKISCYDENCETCFSEEKGACEDCNDGYTNKMGQCIKLPDKDKDGNCPDGYYLDNNICKEKCSGVDCSNQVLYYYTCPSSECLVCQNNVLYIFSDCDDSENCDLDGCFSCITNEECGICNQGRYNIGGKCEKCIYGCASCSNNETCDYCLSGFELSEDKKKCNKNNNFDFNVTLYKIIKNRMLEFYYPYELNKNISNNNNTNSTNNSTNNKKQSGKLSYINYCDDNCIECYQNTKICGDCNSGYLLKDNKCLKCSNDNCLICPVDINNCTKANDGYYILNGEVLKCYDDNCNKCDNGEENSCTECKSNYKLYNGICSTTGYSCRSKFPNCAYCGKNKCLECDSNFKLNNEKGTCKANANYALIIFSIIAALFIACGIIFFFIYQRKKNEHINELENIINNYGGGDSNNINVYSIRQNLGASSSRNLNKKDLMKEFDELKLKNEKGVQVCQFCKKLPGQYICDCGCIVCKEHSKLNKKDKNKICLVCGKIVKNVKPKYTNCQICMQNKMVVTHFKCNCALEVCKNCYVKCKMGSDRCPACRREI